MEIQELSVVAQRMNQLSEVERTNALDKARSAVAVPPKAIKEPMESDFIKTVERKYPPQMQTAMYVLCGIMLVVAFLPSAMRLHAVGLVAVGAVISHPFSQYLAALCVVLMAETGQVAFTLAATVTDESKSRVRFWLNVGSAICTLIALVGNGIAVFDATHTGGKDAFEVFSAFSVAAALRFAFVMLETFAPPILVLIVSTILKSLALDAISTRYSGRIKYQDAYHQWLIDTQAAADAFEERFKNAHLEQSWLRHMSNALREALRNKNKQSTTVLRALTDYDWYMLIQREMQVEEWYSRALPVIVVESPAADALPEGETQPPKPRRVQRTIPSSSGNPTGEFTGKVHQLENGKWVSQCPLCDWKSSEFDAERSAINALTAHARHKHKKIADPAIATE